MAKYTVDEFLGYASQMAPIRLSNEVDKKISLLYDLCILNRRVPDNGRDPREKVTRKMLLDCPSLVSIDNSIHGVIVGKYTLDDLLKTRGYLREEVTI